MKALLSLMCLSLPLSAETCLLTVNQHGNVSFTSRTNYFYKLFRRIKVDSTQEFSSLKWEALGDGRRITFTNVFVGAVGFYRLRLTSFPPTSTANGETGL